jgi:hypothetical protein
MQRVMMTRSADGGPLRPQDGDVVDLTDSGSAETWATVAEAAEAAGVDAATVRAWYRAGRVPTQREEGRSRRILVPLDAVVALASGAEEVGEALASEVIDLNASYWSSETEAAREEAASARAELSAVENQLVFLRAQLAEALEGERTARARLADLEAENEVLRASLEGDGSISDGSWVERSTMRYESPVRRQRFVPPSEAREPAAAESAPVETVDEQAEPPAEVAHHPAPGEHADDFLPQHERGRRRGRR